jgi:hypothetical protein
MYLEELLDKVRPYGMRGASEIRHLVNAFDNPANQLEHDRAVAAFPLIAAAVGMSADALQVTFREIAEDPFTEYLEEVWS